MKIVNWLILGVVILLSISTLRANAAFGELASNCGNVNVSQNGTGIRGCMNFTMYPGQIKVESWTLVNSNNYPLNFYVVSPYYGNSSSVPKIVYNVPCNAGNNTNLTVYNTTLQQNITSQVPITCIIPSDTNYTIPVIVSVSKNVPINATWGDCTSCLSVVYTTQTSENSNSSVELAYGTAKRILVNVVPQPKIVNKTIIQPSGQDSNNQSNSSVSSQKALSGLVPTSISLGSLTIVDIIIAIISIGIVVVVAFMVKDKNGTNGKK